MTRSHKRVESDFPHLTRDLDDDPSFVNDETQLRRELRLVPSLIDRWTHLSLASPHLVAYIAVNVACPFHPSGLLAATRRLAPYLVATIPQRRRTPWWRALAQTDPLLCLRLALETRLSAAPAFAGPRDPERIFERLRAQSLVDSWTSLDRLGPRAAVELADALLEDVGSAFLSDALRRLSPALRSGAIRCGPDRRREWLAPVARFHPFLAVKIGVEAVLRQDVENDLSEWTVPILNAIPARRRSRRRRRPCAAAA